MGFRLEKVTLEVWECHGNVLHRFSPLPTSHLLLNVFLGGTPLVNVSTQKSLSGVLAPAIGTAGQRVEDLDT